MTIATSFPLGTHVPAMNRPATCAKKKDAFPTLDAWKPERSTLGSVGPITSPTRSDVGDVHSENPPSIRGTGGGAPRYPTSRAGASSRTVTTAPGATISPEPPTIAASVSPLAEVTFPITDRRTTVPTASPSSGNRKGTRRAVGVFSSRTLALSATSRRLLMEFTGAEPMRVTVIPLRFTVAPWADRVSRRIGTFAPTRVWGTTISCSMETLPPREFTA